MKKRKENKTKEIRRKRKGKEEDEERMSDYRVVTVIGDGPVEDSGKLVRAHGRTGDDVEPDGVGEGASVTSVPDQLLALETTL